MGSADYSGSAPQRSVLEVLKTASAELLELRAHYETVSHRIRTLRTAVDALRKLESRSPTAESEASSLLSSQSAFVVREGHDLDTTQAKAGFHGANVGVGRNPDLRRACRIALLEASDAASEQDICRRIVRRGSYRFVNIGTAASSIVEELDALVDLGEVHRFDSPEGRLWQRTSPGSDPEDAAATRC